MNIILFSVSGQEAHQDEAGRDPGAERAHHAEPCEHRPRLPLHSLHDLRLPHPRQALLHPRPHERRRPPLPPLPGLQFCMLPVEFSNCVYGGSVIWRTLAANIHVSAIPVTSDSQQVFNVLVHNHFYVRDKVICFLLKGDGESNFYFFSFLSRSIR